MKLSQSPVFVTTLSLTEQSDIHLLFMAGLVFVAGLAGLGTVSLLLLLAPFATLFLGRTRPRRVATVSTAPARKPDGGAPRPPSSLGGGKQGAACTDH